MILSTLATGVLRDQAVNQLEGFESPLPFQFKQRDDDMNEPTDIRFGASVNISIKEFENDPDRCKHMADTRLREEISHFIQKEKGELIEHHDYFEKRLELYVATPEEFWRIINHKAEELAFRFAPRTIPDDVS